MASAAAELVVEREPEPIIEMTDTNRTFAGAQGLVKMALDQYTEILTTVSDPRVSDWPLMDSPIPTFLIVLLYLYGVTILGPRVMANRKPFKLRGTLVAYNAFQVVFSLGMLYEVSDSIVKKRNSILWWLTGRRNKSSFMIESSSPILSRESYQEIQRNPPFCRDMRCLRISHELVGI
ncbi:hypothetical protein K0M31_020384 [Melipona bicolor]|uniref:Elongation of very long chain fatty acids protein n=1 Tax=Melipona bicolor TaxID=60889 RepID=A0AA40G1H0_9HYME|nr:hypothetical protein K0M31_020384 [Melipona bicolor]